MLRYLKWLLHTGVVLFVVIALLVLAVAFTLGTESGTRWAINTIDARIPGDLEVAEFSGTLWSGLQIANLTYRDADRELTAEQLAIDVFWPGVLTGRAILDHLYATAIVYRPLQPPEPGPNPFELSMPQLPVVIGVNYGAVDRFIFRGNSDPLELEGMTVMRARLNGNRLRARAASLVLGPVSYSASALDTTISGQVPLSAAVSWKLTSGAWSGSGQASGSLAELHIEQSVSGPFPGAVEGTIAIVDRIDPLFDLAVNWQRWEFGDVVLENGELRVEGTLDDYVASYDATLHLPALPISQVEGTAQGDLRSLARFDVRMSSSDGNASASGNLSWLPEFNADARVSLTNVDPALIHAALSGNLAASGNVTVDQAGSVRVTNAEISGVANDAVIDIRGEFQKQEDTYRCTGCVVNADRNRVEINGQYSSGGVDAALVVNAPALEQLWPDIGGSLAGSGELAGPLNDLHFVGQVSGDKLVFADWSADHLLVTSRDSSATKLDLRVEVDAFSRGESDLGSLSATLNGTREQFLAEVEWQRNGVDVSAAANLRRDDDDIKGELLRASIVEPKTGEWALLDSVEFSSGGGAFEVDAHEWRGAHGRLLISRLSRSDDEIHLSGRVADIPLQVADTFLPSNFGLQGAANAEVDLHYVAAAWSGNINWLQTDSVLRVRELGDEFTDVRIPRFAVDGSFAGGGAEFVAQIEVDPGVSGDLQVSLETIDAQTPFTALLQLQGNEWEWVSAILPMIENFEGLVAANVRASGILSSPQFNGDLTWREGSIDVPALNVPIREVDVVLTGASDGRATVRGSAKAGKGALAIDGQLDELMTANRSLEVKLSGQTAELVNWPEYHLWASPDVTIRGNARGWSINGSVAVPEAEINIQELPVEAVTPSSDVVVLGDERETEGPTRFSGDVRLQFGKQVHINAFGLDTRLTGDLEVRSQVNRPMRAYGRVQLVDGVFAAYGQKLNIEEGTLTFTGPLDDPLVDVRAVRIIESLDGTVTAGIHLQGRARTLSSSVYAEPAMSEAEALSYLVLGRPLEQATDAEGGELSGAAVALGLRQATRITEQLGASLGLDQLALTGNGGESTALVAGKQLNSRVYARYAYGVFNRLGTLLLRYRLSERLSLEAGAGEQQSIDILYTVREK